jgi:hypothetical protein
MASCPFSEEFAKNMAVMPSSSFKATTQGRLHEVIFNMVCK